MAFIVDQPLPDGECWFRCLTNMDHVTSAGTVHHAALKGKGAFSPSQGKKWAHELSGSVVSLMGGVSQIETNAHARIAEIRKKLMDEGKPVPRAIQFAGIASATAAELRATALDRARTDVVYTPLDHNPAHADVVTYQTTSDTLDPVRDWLMTILRVTYATNLSLLVSSCGKMV
jgi:hypothetical protein